MRLPSRFGLIQARSSTAPSALSETSSHLSQNSHDTAPRDLPSTQRAVVLVGAVERRKNAGRHRGGTHEDEKAAAPYEAHLFTTDYEDDFLALARNTSEPVWLGLTKNRVPAVVLPATLTAFGASPTNLELAPGAFGLQNKPYSSIKSVYLSQPGACSQEFDYKSVLFDLIDSSLRGKLFTNRGATCFQRNPLTGEGVTGVRLLSDNFASFIQASPLPISTTRAGRY